MNETRVTVIGNEPVVLIDRAESKGVLWIVDDVERQYPETLQCARRSQFQAQYSFRVVADHHGEILIVVLDAVDCLVFRTRVWRFPSLVEGDHWREVELYDCRTVHFRRQVQRVLRARATEPFLPRNGFYLRDSHVAFVEQEDFVGVDDDESIERRRVGHVVDEPVVPRNLIDNREIIVDEQQSALPMQQKKSIVRRERGETVLVATDRFVHRRKCRHVQRLVETNPVAAQIERTYSKGHAGLFQSHQLVLQVSHVGIE